MPFATRQAAAILGVLATIGCGKSPITAKRIEPAIERTFANLVELQVARMRLPPMAAPDFAVTAICRRQMVESEAGAGEWTCRMVWQGPNRRTLRDEYELFDNTDGCYTATLSSESLGGPVLIAPDGRKVKNLLYAFEGCFDTT